MEIDDGLSNRQRAIAWIERYCRSLAGEAIINQDLTFRTANPQFCDLLEVSLAELQGKDYTDLTSAETRELERANAALTVMGKQPAFVTERDYQFRDGRSVRVIQLLNPVFRGEGKDQKFDFFIAQILRLESLSSASASSPKTPWQFTSLSQYWHIVTTAVGVLAWIIYEVAKLWAGGGVR